MKLLLIGKTGQLGSAIVEHAHAAGFDVVAVDKDTVDITNEQSVNECISSNKPDVVVNTAAFHVVPMCEEKPDLALAVNAVAVGNLAKQCKEHSALFLTYSTDYVFSGNVHMPYTEDANPQPLQMYGISKVAGEYAARAYYPEGTIIIRTNGLYGGGKTGSPEKGGNFVLSIIKNAEGKETIEVSSDQTISPTYAGDLCVATLALINKKPESGIYHLVNEGACTWAEFAAEILKQSGSTARVTPVDRSNAPGMKRPHYSALANTKAKALGITLPAWKEGLGQYMNELGYGKH